MSEPSLESIATIWWPVERIERLIELRRAMWRGVDMAIEMDTRPTEISRIVKRIRDIGIDLPPAPSIRGRRPKAVDPEVQMRKCMCCLEMFQSTHKFNRMCDLCKEIYD